MGEPRIRNGLVWVCHVCPYWMRGLDGAEKMACPNGHYMDQARLLLVPVGEPAYRKCGQCRRRGKARNIPEAVFGDCGSCLGEGYVPIGGDDAV